jgi:hypothetical protein
MVTLQIVPYSEIEDLSSVGRIRKLLNIILENKIVLLQGRLKKDEEKELIKATMEEINQEFTGIELTTIESEVMGSTKAGKLKKFFADLLLGDRLGMTVIGPASIVKEIKKDPSKIEVFTNDLNQATIANFKRKKRKNK